MDKSSSIGKQRTLHEIIEEVDQKKKRKCDCWLDVGSCYCEILKNDKNEK